MTGTDRGELRAALWPSRAATATRLLRCRHCARRNRVDVPSALLAPERVECGSCGESLFVGPGEPLVGLSAEAYLHGSDRRSLHLLQSLPAIPALMRALLERVGDRPARLLFLSDAIRCGDDQFPELVELVERAGVRLDLPFRPAVYLGESPHMNAQTTGVRDPIVLVRSSLLDQMGDLELVAILGHELGHLHANHPIYRSMATALLWGGGAAWPALRLVSAPARRILLRWGRAAELTADRAALLAAGDLEACLRMLLTLAGGNRPGTTGRTQMRLGPFVRQCRELARIEASFSFDGLLASALSMDRTHPHVARRVMHLIQWATYGNYLDILSGRYPRRTRSGDMRSRRE